jgi:hypothetical protein
MPFFACKDFFLSPSISLVLLSYAAQVVAMAIVNSSNTSFERLSIDLVIFAYIDDLTSNA